MDKLSKNIITNILSFISPSDILSCHKLNKAIREKVSTSLISFTFPQYNRNLQYPLRQMITSSEILQALLYPNLSPKFTVAKLDLSQTRINDSSLYNLLSANQFLTSLTINLCFDISDHIYDLLLLNETQNKSVANSLTELNAFGVKMFSSTKPGFEKIFPKLRFLRCNILSNVILSEALKHPSIELLQFQENVNQTINNIVKAITPSKSLKWVIYPMDSVSHHYLEPIEHPVLKGVYYYNNKDIYNYCEKDIDKLANAYSNGLREPPNDNYIFNFTNSEDKLYNVIGSLIRKYQFCSSFYRNVGHDFIGWAISKNYVRLANLLLCFQNNIQYITVTDTTNSYGFMHIFDGTDKGITEPTIIMFDVINSPETMLKYDYTTSYPFHANSIFLMHCSYSCWILQSNKDINKLKAPMMLCGNHCPNKGIEYLADLIAFKTNATAKYFPNSKDKLSKESLCGLNKCPINLVDCKIAVYGNYANIYADISKLLYRKQLPLDLLQKINSTFPTLLPSEKNYLPSSYMARKSLLLIAIEIKNPEIYAYLIENEFGIELTDKCQWTPLHQAAASNDTDAAKILLEKKPYLDINALEWNHKSALTIANKLGNKEMIHFLTSRNAIAPKECIII